jgi:hypothetical protein
MSFQKQLLAYTSEEGSAYPSGASDFTPGKGDNQNPKSKKNRQHNGKKKKYKRTNNDLQDIHIKLKIE